MIPKAFFLCLFALQLPSLSWGLVQPRHASAVGLDEPSAAVVISPDAEAPATTELERRQALVAQDNVIRAIVEINRTWVEFNHLDAGDWNADRSLNNGEVKFAASSPLRVHDARFAGYARAIGTAEPQANPALGVKFPTRSWYNVFLKAVFVVDGRVTPVSWVVECFAGTFKWGAVRPDGQPTSLYVSTGRWPVTEARILATNVPAGVRGTILLHSINYDMNDDYPGLNP